eukprot:6486915-Amphidinium_carterae.2
MRIGEAKVPGPPPQARAGGGSIFRFLRSTREETWLLEGSLRSASFKAQQQGYEGVFVAARKDKTLGRGKGGLAVLSRIGAPMLRASCSAQADLGRWVRVLLQVRPEECLHVINLYGWVDDDLATRQVLLEVTERTAELLGSHVLVGGDWNLEPEEFPIDLLQGAGLHRPLARPGASAPTELAPAGLVPRLG